MSKMAPAMVEQKKSFLSAGAGLLQRKCEKCRKKKQLLQKRSEHAGPSVVPPIVHEVLNSPGQPLDSETRAFFEPRFGHDFRRMQVHSVAPQASASGLRIGPPNDSYEKEADQVADRILEFPQSREQNGPEEAGFDLSRVRLHADARAAQSAQAVGARAFTVGRDIVFGTGQYQPGTAGGMRLMAHELVHFMQQAESIPAGSIQRQDISGEEEQVGGECPVDAKHICDSAQSYISAISGLLDLLKNRTDPDGIKTLKGLIRANVDQIIKNLNNNDCCQEELATLKQQVLCLPWPKDMIDERDRLVRAVEDAQANAKACP